MYNPTQIIEEERKKNPELNLTPSSIIEQERKKNPELDLTPSSVIKKEFTTKNINKQTNEAFQQQEGYISGPEDYSTFDEEQSKKNIYDQLKYQDRFLHSRGYNYANPKDKNFIHNYMADNLSKAGIKDIRQLGYEEIEMDSTITPYRTIVEKDGKTYYSRTMDQNSIHDQPKTKLIELNPEDVKDKKYFISETVKVPLGMGAYKDTKKLIEISSEDLKNYDKKDITVQGKIPEVTQRVLINKDTGERVVQGKYGGVLGYGKYNEDPNQRGVRWGNTTQVEGMADFMIQFDKEGNPLIYSQYQDTTSTYVAPVLTAASLYLTAQGIPGLEFGSKLATKAVTNALVQGTMAEIQGRDFFEAALPAFASPYFGKALNIGIANTMGSLGKFSTNVAFDQGIKNTIGAATFRMGMAGFNTMAYGGDLKSNLTRGFIQGAAEGFGGSLFDSKLKNGDIVKGFISEKDLDFITNHSNLSYDSVKGITTFAFGHGVAAMSSGGDFFDTFKESLIAGGVSESLGIYLDDNLKKKFNPNSATYDTIKKTSTALTEAYIKATLQGRELTPEQIQMIATRVSLKSIVEPTVDTVVDLAKERIQQVKNFTTEEKEEVEELALDYPGFKKS